MPRKPLLKHPEIIKHGRLPPHYMIGVVPSEHRPEHAQVIGECLMAWPHVDLQMAQLLATLLKTESRAALAVYLTLKRRSPRVEAITSAANIVLAAEENELLSAILSIVRATETERNALAHGYFGACDSIPEDILWISATDYALFVVDFFQPRQPPDFARPPEPDDKLSSHVYYYEMNDLSEVHSNILLAHDILNKFCMYLRFPGHGPFAPRRKDLFDQLTGLFPIQEAVKASRQDAQSRNAKSRP